MADEVTDVVEQPVTEVEQPKTLDVEAKLAEMDAKLSEYKNSISGLDRKNTELSQALESERTAHMTDKEKAEHDREQYAENLTRREADIEKAQFEIMFTRGLADAGLPPEARDFVIAPTNDDETKVWTTKVNAIIKAGIEKGVNEALLRNGGPAPKAGATITPMTQAQVDKGFDWAAWEGKPVAEKNAAWEQYLEAASAAQ